MLIKAMGGTREVSIWFEGIGMPVEIFTIQKWRCDGRGIPWRYASWIANRFDLPVDEVRPVTGRNGK